MKKQFWCMFVVVALMYLVGCKNGIKDDNTQNNAPDNIDDNETDKVYQIGDIGPGGGIVFYTSEVGFEVYDGQGGKTLYHHLEMSASTLGKSKWFLEHSDMGTKTDLGYGKANTYKIVNTSTSTSLTEENCAAYRCIKYSTNSTQAGDWWLPSKDELNLMYKNQKDAVLATCGDREDYKWQWSSSEVDTDSVWFQFFEDGTQTYDSKLYFDYSVRAVRAF